MIIYENKWQAIRLKYLATINDEALPETTEPDFELSYLDIGNVNSSGNIETPTKYLFADAPSRARRIVKHGDIVISTVRTYLQAIAAIEQPVENLIVSTGFAVIRPKKNIFFEGFCKYALRESKFLAEVQKRSVGVSYPAINASDLGDIFIKVPTFEEQLKVSEFLDKELNHIDSLIKAKEDLLTILSEKRQALINQAVTRGLNPNTRMKDSGVEWLGEVPKHWEVKKLKYFAEVCYGIGDELDKSLTTGTPLISLPNVSIDGRLDLSNTLWVELADEQKPIFLLKKGDLLFNWRNGSAEHLAKTAYFEADGEYTHVGFLLRIRFDSSNYNSRFFQFYINALRTTGFFLYSKAMVNNTFNQSELENLLMLIPPFEEQNSITSYLIEKIGVVDSLSKHTLTSLSLLKERRAALITAAVTGQIEIPAD